jgi:hypothetical protein
MRCKTSSCSRSRYAISLCFETIQKTIAVHIDQTSVGRYEEHRHFDSHIFIFRPSIASAIWKKDWGDILQANVCSGRSEDVGGSVVNVAVGSFSDSHGGHCQCLIRVLCWRQKFLQSYRRCENSWAVQNDGIARSNSALSFYPVISVTVGFRVPSQTSLSTFP